ncbi:electron transfer flavoprotein beta subunit lysine methyltransferase isoform X2 [Eurytemora carolleeae]|uniref:electron transfer flavoprotein beta subunit lysine methyltransferase isoform X2 n=1 Tax=Eurytemora carolleeae TaxID=1294199 RepID=UPI000C77AFE2|nr:electron transfer flavoprotein beta subunit lysine methyltransferase isoform X2 [Eurytemora carolleeae]|eukprot:XP_023340436.1 electron transfer flavoprotein beta subunit lysine methyltransferase-like isoform X2 [Eurytemora affinis]
MRTCVQKMRKCVQNMHLRRYTSRVTEEFIKQNLTISTDHLTPEIKLLLISHNSPLYTQPIQDSSSSLQDPWWTIYWPGGQVLSRYFLDFPHLVQGKHVLDIGSGCGALRCQLCGAADVTANDIDLNARTALSLNSNINNIQNINFSSTDHLTHTNPNKLKEFDILCVGDLLYDARREKKFIK